MKRRYLFSIVAALTAGFTPVIMAQTAGQADLVKFTKVTAPVPNQRVQGSQPAGEFFHATYTGAAWGDYDEDGLLDLYYSHTNEMIGSTAYSNLYHNDGGATFTRTAFSPFSPTSFSSPAWLDVNNDGHLDLFVSGIGQGGYGWNDDKTNFSPLRSYLYLGRGDGTFEEVTGHGVTPLFNGMAGGKAHNWVATGDFDHDGYTDLAIAGFDEMARPATDHPEEAVRVVQLYRNMEGRGFERVENPVDGNAEFHGLTDGSVVMCDLDGDGWLDLFTTGYGATRNAEAYIYWNNGNGTFSQGEGLPVPGLTDASSSVADLNNDGRLDLVLTGVYSDTGRKHFFVCRNDGGRAFTQMTIDNLEGVDGGQLAFGDVNHDGLMDMLVGGHGATHEHMTCLYMNQGNFTFTIVGAYYDDPFGKKGSFSRVTHGAQHLVDVNDDGYLDAWISGWSNGGCSKGCLTELYTNNSGANGVTANEAPAAPMGLRASAAEGGNEVAFHWQAGSDDVTPESALRYNLYVREKEASDVFMIIPADLTTGRLKVSALTGALNTCTYRMTLPAGKDFEWGVQAIDNGNVASAWTVSEVSSDQSGLDTKLVDHQSGAMIKGVRGGIHYRVSDATVITAYLPSGNVVAQATVTGEGILPLQVKGIVVVKAESATQSQSCKVAL